MEVCKRVHREVEKEGEEEGRGEGGRGLEAQPVDTT